MGPETDTRRHLHHRALHDDLRPEHSPHAFEYRDAGEHDLGAALVISALLGGWLSDRHGRRVLTIAPRLAFLGVTYPAFLLITTRGSPAALLSMVAVLALFQGMSGAALVLALPECFPRAVRTSGLSLTYAVGVTLFGSTAQFVVTWLLELTKNPMAIAWYVLFANVISVVAISRLRPPQANSARESPRTAARKRAAMSSAAKGDGVVTIDALEGGWPKCAFATKNIRAR